MQNLESIERASDTELADMGFNAIAGVVGRAAQQCGEFSALDDQQRDLLNRGLSLLDRVDALGASAESNVHSLVRIMVLGKLGRFDDAIAEATRAHAVNPTWHTAITVANASRRAGDLQRAIEMWTIAAQLDQKDVTALLEIGDTHLHREDWDAAIRAYELAIEREGKQPWAVPSLHYCRYRATGDRKWLQRVKRLASKSPDDCGVAGLLAQLTGSYAPDVGIQRAQQLLEFDKASQGN